MSLPWSRCGNYEPHDPHPARTIREGDCPGWTPHEQLVRTLITSVNEYLREHYGPFIQGWSRLPEGLRLEMHPGTRQWLLVNADLNGPGSYYGFDLDQFRVPVRVTTDVPEGSWRLVIVTEEVLLDDKTAAAAHQETL